MNIDAPGTHRTPEKQPLFSCLANGKSLNVLDYFVYTRMKAAIGQCRMVTTIYT